MFVVQYCSRAFGSGEAIPERMWGDQRRFRSLERARKFVEQEKRAARKLWGPNAWGGHWRIITTQDVPMVQRFTCVGWIETPYGAEWPRGCQGTFAVEHYVWPAGKTDPGPARTHGVLCPHCEAAEQAAQAEYDSREAARA